MNIKPPFIESNKLLGLLFVFFAATLLFTLAFYSIGVMSPFQFDDFANLSQLSHVSSKGLESYVFGNISGPTGRPVAMASFLLNDQTWPAYAPDFKFTNVLLHLVNGLLVLWFLMLLLNFCGYKQRKALLIGVLATCLWISISAHLATVLYVVQRMTLLSVGFSLCYLICCLKISLAMRHASSGVFKLVTLVLGSAHVGERDRVLQVLNDAGIMTRPIWTLMHRLPML